MSIASEKISKILKEKNISQRKICELLKKSKSHISHILNGERTFPQKHIKKLLPVLEVSREEFDSWIVTDEYSKKIMEKAIIEAKKKKEDTKTVFAENMDKILKEKGIPSRKIFADLIKYDQSSVNKMVNCKISLSPKVIKGCFDVLGIPEEDVLAWNLADKYSLKTLEMALELKKELG